MKQVKIFGVLCGMGVFFWVMATTPPASYHVDRALTWVKGWLAPAGELPAAVVGGTNSGEALWLPDLLSVEPTKDVVPLQNTEGVKPMPLSITLAAPPFNEKQDYQDWNNCGPATLALALRYWGWQGDQYDISEDVKPENSDKNVNAEELAAYVEGGASNLQAEIRFGGNLTKLKEFLAAGFPVIIETSFHLEKPAWPGDDLWAGHYLLLTGYDEERKIFITQDSFYGPDQTVSYHDLYQDWQPFNRLYMVVFPLDHMEEARVVFGSEWSQYENLVNTLAGLRTELAGNETNAFLWFDLGMTLVNRGDYAEGAAAFAKARQLGLPQRILRYQSGPFIAAFETGDKSDLKVLVNYALKITPDSEEALFWKGKAAVMTDNLSKQETMFMGNAQYFP